VKAQFVRDIFQNDSFGFVASHSVKLSKGLDKTFCALEMFSDVSNARGEPGKSLAKPDSIFVLISDQRLTSSWPICQRDSFSAPAT
jgi:hypothetical protein